MVSATPDGATAGRSIMMTVLQNTGETTALSCSRDLSLKYRIRLLTTLRNSDNVFIKTDMSSPRRNAELTASQELSGWIVRGGPHEVTAPFAPHASRFVLEARGRWKSAVARPANAMGLSMATGGLESEFHSHREAQLLYIVRGEVICEASNALWLVPPQSALWIPGGMTHRLRANAPLEAYAAFVDPERAPKTPNDCCAVSVTPLFRELLFRMATLPALYELDGPDARLMSVLLDELATLTVDKHSLPMPTDARLRRLVETIRKNPADPVPATEWARRIGVSERTLNRLLTAETGLSFGRWKKQLHIILAIQKMSRGASVQSVALDLGYESSSSFVTMFRKELGTSPARYMARRLTTS